MASPYLGVKTEFSMAMFSNLRQNWNHLVAPIGGAYSTVRITQE